MIDGENPFIILARITVKEGLVNDYLTIAEEADKAFVRTEEGMLFHNFDEDLKQSSHLGNGSFNFLASPKSERVIVG